MQTLFIALLMALGAVVSRAYAKELPDLGSGDPRLVVGLLGESKVKIIARDIQKCDNTEDWGSSVNYDKLDELMMPYWIDNNVAGGGFTSFYRCYPFGKNQGFIQYGTKFIERPDRTIAPIYSVTEIEWNNTTPISRIINSAELRNIFGLEGDEQFVGELDDKIFWWNWHHPDMVYFRDRINNTVFVWQIRNIYIVEGVVRGNHGKDSFGIAGYHWTHDFFAPAPGAFSIIQVLTKDAVRVTETQKGLFADFNGSQSEGCYEELGRG